MHRTKMNPIPTYNGPIAVIDMLGFKNYVENNSLSSVINNYAHQITKASFTSEVLNENLEFMVYSDTIAIRLVNQSEKGFYNFIKAIQLISSDYFWGIQFPRSESLPIRGAITIGEYAWHNGDISTLGNGREIKSKRINFIVGNAIIDAHEHEKTQEWIGISMNNLSAQRIKQIFPKSMELLLTERTLIKYNIPHKKVHKAGFAVNPTIRANFDSVFYAFQNLCEKLIKDKNEASSIKAKYFNTLKYLNYLHEKDYLLPVFNDFTEEEKEKQKIKIEKKKYREIFEYYNNSIK